VRDALVGVCVLVLGRRDYAILKLLATYGVRASEIVDLRLDDIDWRAAVLHIRHAADPFPTTPLHTSGNGNG
jgi:integrase